MSDIRNSRAAAAVPNAITVGRLALVPLLVSLLVGRPDAERIALAVFAVAAASDALDGYLARSWRCTSVFGKVMDPIADKLLVCGAFLALACTGRLAVWVVAVVLGREVAVTLLRTFAARRSASVIPASRFGKAKMATQTAAIVVLIAAGGAHGWIHVLVVATVLATVASGVDYFLNYRRRLERVPAGVRVAAPLA